MTDYEGLGVTKRMTDEQRMEYVAHAMDYEFDPVQRIAEMRKNGDPDSGPSSLNLLHEIAHEINGKVRYPATAMLDVLVSLMGEMTFNREMLGSALTIAKEFEPTDEGVSSVRLAVRDAVVDWNLMSPEQKHTISVTAFISTRVVTAIENSVASAEAEHRRQIAGDIQEGKPAHVTREYNVVDQAYDRAARIALGTETP